MNLKERRDCTKLNLHIVLKIMLAYLGSVLNIMIGVEMAVEHLFALIIYFISIFIMQLS